jgi:alcohol dehydrogenase class IV
VTPASAVERALGLTAGRDLPRVFFGEGCSRALVRLLEEYRATSIFLVSGGDSFQRSGAAAALEPAIGRIPHHRLGGVRPNPTIEEVRVAVEAYRSSAADVVIGVGGGSVMDVAKMAAVLGSQPGDPLDYVTGQRPLQQARSCKLVLVPTTAGSGSEATSFAAVYVEGRKHSLDHPTVQADAALVDPLLSASQPPSVAASSALDALSHAVESYWSSRSTAASRRLAAAALQRLTRQLPRLGADPDRYTRSALALAALQAGQAIDVTRTTAAHAFAYPLTARFGVQHGHACALHLSWLFDYNQGVGEADSVDPRGPAFVRQQMSELRHWFGAAEREELRPRLQALVAQVHFAHRLSRLGLTESDLGLVIEDAFASNRLGNNPRAVTAEAALAGLRAIL